MTGGVSFEVHCPLCDAIELRHVSTNAGNKIYLNFDGDSKTLEWEVNCTQCDFPVRGSSTNAKVTLVKITGYNSHKEKQ
jgi:hypothetical protein